jgi:Outer membrane lipoprotein-sorting protein
MGKIILLFLLLFIATASYAETPEAKGLRIAREADRRDSGFGDSSARLTMILMYQPAGKNSKPRTSIRKIRSKILEVRGDGDKSISIFNEPYDVKGTAMLTYSHKSGNDDQWLYLPAIKRVKRISSANKSGSFMGSEFAFEDISSQEVEKYTYRFIKEEKCNSHDCYVIERVPAYKYSGYRRQLLWLDKKEYRAIKLEFYDRKNDLLKTQTFSKYKKHLNKYWRAHEMLMVNHQNNRSTKLIWENFKFRNGYSNRHFSRNGLKNAR